MADPLKLGAFDMTDAEFAGTLGAISAPEPAPPVDTGSPVKFNQSTKEIWVNGNTFLADDHTSALASERYFEGGPTRDAAPEGFRDVSADEFSGYIQRIKHPSLGRLVKKNFGIGVDNLQMLGGSALRFAGAEETGKAIVDQQIEDLSKTQPYQREFTNIKSGRGAVEWFVAAVSQQGPLLIESALAAVAGGVAGAVAGGGGNPFTAIGGAMMALGSKEAVKQAAMAAVRKQAAGEVLDKTETNLLKELATGAIRSGAKTGTKAGIVANSYGIGVGDIYGEQIDSGDPDRATTALLGVPYALMEALPQLAALGFATRGRKGVLTGGTRLKRGAQRLKNAGGVGLKGAVFEGTTEVGQESILLGVNTEVDANSREGMLRLINSFAAGAAVGGGIGALGGAAQARRPDAAADPGVDAAPVAPTGPTDPTAPRDLLNDLPPGAGTVPEIGIPPGAGTVPEIGIPEGAGVVPPVDLLGGQQLEGPAQFPTGQNVGNAPTDIYEQENLGTGIEGPAQFPTGQEVGLAPTDVDLFEELPAASPQKRLVGPETPELLTAEAQITDPILAGQDVNILGQNNIGQNFTGEESVTLSYTLTDTGEVGSFEVSVREALEDSRNRISALTELRKCLMS